MSGYRVCQCSLLAFVAYILVACQFEDQLIPVQRVVEWPEQRLVFIADSRTGQVRSFFLGNGAPVLFAQTRRDQRSSVRDLRLDSQHQQLWVLGDDSVDVYEARNLMLQKRLPLDAQEVSVIGIAADRKLFVARMDSIEAVVR
ncbi:MAG: hypothetical protein WCL27_08900 [Betaproteobacteria bacterium]